MEKRDYYQVLEISHNATSEEIKKAYRRLALKFHPDRNQGNSEAEEKFKEASEAYSVLGNDEKRKLYDSYGFDGLKTGGSPDFSFFSDSIFSDFEDILGGFFGFGSSSRRQHRNGPRRGQDAGMEYHLTMEEAYKGVEKTIQIARIHDCKNCHGSGSEPGKQLDTCQQCGGGGNISRKHGFFAISTTCPICKGEGKIISHPCQECDGKGRIEESKEIKVTFPAGVDSGNRLRVGGEGDEGLNGGPPGDLYILISVDEDDFFRRDENDLILKLPITFSQAVLGDEVKVETYYGMEKIKIPAETQSETVIRKKGKGFKNVNGWGRGDFLVVIKVTTPNRPSKREKEIFKELREHEKKRKDAPFSKDQKLYH